MIDTKALRSKILDLAIQGKLTEQLPEDGTAEELYEQIQEERNRQEADGAIKTIELVYEIDKTKITFSIPSNWKWTCLGNVSYIVRGGSPRPIKQYITTRDDGINWIKIGDVEKGGKYIYSTHEKIIPEGEAKSRRVYPGDFLLTNSMSFGRPYISKIEGCIHDGWLLIHDFNGFIPDYLYYLLSSNYLYGQFTEKASGSTVNNLNIDKVKAAIIPLPPLSEQKRIVDIVQRTFSVLDTIDALQARYADNRKALKSKLIDAAIQGKLTEQLPEDGTAEELYQQIQEEKQKLINAGKLKKEKPLPEIADEELTYHFPSNWIYTKLDKVSTQITDGEHKTPRRVKKYCGYYLLSARNIRNGFITLDDVDYVDNEEYAIISRRCNPKRGDVLISCSGSIGRCAVVEDDNQYVMVRSAALISPLRISSKYLMYVIQSNFVQKQIANKVKQTLQANLFQNAIKNLIIPLPPLSEQKRIVSTLNKLLSLLE